VEEELSHKKESEVALYAYLVEMGACWYCHEMPGAGAGEEIFRPENLLYP